MNCKPVDDSHRISGFGVKYVQLGDDVVRVILVPVCTQQNHRKVIRKILVGA